MVFWTTRWTARVSGSKTKEIKCQSCEKIYRIKVERTAYGSASAGPYGIYGNAGARRSFNKADENLADKLELEFDPVPCPHCGRYQSYMFYQVRSLCGARHNPNEFAEERARLPETQAWSSAHSADTIQSYERFLQVWPTSKLRVKAQVRMSELQGRAEQTAWTPEKSRRAMILRIGCVLAVALAIGLFSYFFGRH